MLLLLEPEPLIAAAPEPEPPLVAATPEPEPLIAAAPEPEPLIAATAEAEPLIAPLPQVAQAEAASEPLVSPIDEPAPEIAAAPMAATITPEVPAAVTAETAPPPEVSSAAPEISPPPVREISPPPIIPAAPVKKPEPEEVTSLVPFSPPEALPSIDEIRRRRSGKFQTEPDVHPHFAYEVPGKGANLRLAAVLFLSAALGCGVGYWAYLQLPSATIPLNVQTQSSALLVSWPTGQTRDAKYAAIRVDDGEQVQLTPEQRSSGHATITPTSDNVKIELIAQHWMRDSRGIVRYVKAPPPLQAQAVNQ